MDGPARKRVKVIRQELEFAPEPELRARYLEIYGATAATTIPTERIRESLYEACDELLEEP
jgi:hypothetical protein